MSDTGVLVAAVRAGGGDRLLTFLTRGRGAVRLYARRQARRGGPGTAAWHEPLQGGELSYTRSRGGGPGRLLAFQARRVWRGIREDFDRTVHAMAFLELLTAYLTEEESQGELFALLVRFLDRVERDTRPDVARLIASLRLLAISGFAPRLGSCVACGTPAGPAAQEARFSAEAGGLVCRGCAATRREGTLPVSPAARGFMARALELPDARAWRLRASPTVAGEVSRLLDAFHEARTGIRMRAAAFLAAAGGCR